MSQKLVQKRDEKIKLFLQSIKSDETRRLYIVCLNKWLEYMGTKKILLEVNPKKVEQKIIDFIISMKEKSKSFAAIHNYISAVIKFYTINDVVLNSNKIYRFMPEKKKSQNFFIKNLWYLVYSPRMHVVEIFPQMILNTKQD